MANPVSPNYPLITFLNGELTYVDVLDNDARGVVTVRYWNREKKALMNLDMKFVVDATYLQKTLSMFKLNRRVKLVGALSFFSGLEMRVHSVNFLDSGNISGVPQKRTNTSTGSSPRWKTLKK